MLPPETVLRHLGLSPGRRLLDLGAGPGYFALPAALLVEPGGLVVAADVQPAMLAALTARLGDLPLPVVPVATGEAVLPFPDGLFHAALLAHVLGECLEPASLLGEVKRVLRRDGRLLAVDWRRTAGGPGPPDCDRLRPAAVAADLERAGFAVVAEPTLGPCHFAVLAVPR